MTAFHELPASWHYMLTLWSLLLCVTGIAGVIKALSVKCVRNVEASDADKFTDVKKSDLSVNFKKAISWAVSKGIIKGYSDGTFGVRKAIVRKDALIMLYRYADKPSVSVKKTGYTDVDGVYGTSSDTFKAIVWAKANGITNGFTASQAAAAGLTDPAFGSLQPCVREQMITFLYRYNNLK